MKTLFISLLFLQFLLGGVALAHETENAHEELEMSVEEVIEAETVTNADLGVQEPGLLPSSPLYFFKEIGRGLQRALTFNAVAKTELELKIASEKAAEAKEVAEKDPGDERGIERALLNYKQAQERLQSRLSRLGEVSENPNIDTLLDKVAQRIIAHEKLFAELRAKHAEHNATLEDIKDGVDETIEGVAARDTADKFRDRLEQAFENTRGSTFKHLRSIEFIDRLRESGQISDDAKAKLDELRNKLSEKTGENIEKFVEEGEEGAGRLQEALRRIPSNVLKRTVILEEIRARVSERTAHVLDEAIDTGRDAPQVDEQAPDVPSSKSTDCPKLESVLYQFTVAPDPASFARQRGIDYEAGLVRVVIDLNQPDAALPSGFQLRVERRVGRQVRITIPLTSLCALSEEGVVDFVHVPVIPTPL